MRLGRLCIILLIVYVAMFSSRYMVAVGFKIVHQVGATILLGAWLVHLLKERRPIPASPFDRLLWLIPASATLSAVLSADRRVSLEWAWFSLAGVIFFYFFLDLMRTGKSRWVFEGLFFAAACVVLVSALELTAWYWGLALSPQLDFQQGWPQVFGLSIPPQIRPIELAIGHKNGVAAFAVLTFPLVIAWSNSAERRDLRWALRVVAMSLGIVLIFAQSRGGYSALAAVLGMSLFFYLLREDVRGRFPPRVARLLAPRVLVGMLLGGAFVFLLAVYWLTLGGGLADIDDLSRLDLWLSAIGMLRDHPFFGVGTFQFGVTRLEYLNWDGSWGYVPLNEAHNLYLQVLAELGAAGFALLACLVAAFARVWWSVWRPAIPPVKRRLEGVAITCVGFAVFGISAGMVSSSLLIVMTIAGAYTAHLYAAQTGSVPGKTRMRARRPILGLLLLLLMAQTGFVPLHIGSLTHSYAITLLEVGRAPDALDAIRAAQRADPWQRVYQLQEANTLGYLAAQDPAQYLHDALTTYEEALSRVPVWATGWHDLAALYAQAGRYEDAIRAEHEAIALHPVVSGYHFKLGQYYERMGRYDDMRLAYYEALRLQPSLALSDFWTDPAYPDRRRIPPAAAMDSLDKPEAALDIALYSNDLEMADRLAAAIPPERMSAGFQARLDLLASFGSENPCLTCYYLFVEYEKRGAARDYLVEAERLLHDEGERPGNLTAEEAARAALFLSSGELRWGWYILARWMEDTAANSAEIEDLLKKSNELSLNIYGGYFSMTAFGTYSPLATLPQAQTPSASPLNYRPWVELAQRWERSGRPDDARSIYAEVLRYDPDARSIRERLDALR
jgi:tetratricopeptide (TPR) repeat protein